MRSSILFLALSYSACASAQWAVYDKSVHDELIKINSIKALEGRSFTDITKTYKAELKTDTSSPQDLTIGDGDNKAVLKGIDTKFELIDDLTPAEMTKYIGTVAECGSKTASPQVCGETSPGLFLQCNI